MSKWFGKIRCWFRGGHGPIDFSAGHGGQAYCKVCGVCVGTIPYPGERT